ncbi:MAG: glycosyltransferase [Rubripirellula sp.]|nr:glycosyltransferase [Rubripirellula sp.]
MLTTTCIIDTYNHKRFVSEAIESALAQRVPFDQIIVVDDASIDQSQVVLEKRYGEDSRVNLIFRTTNGGQLACIQSGVERATGDICCFLDGDDQYDSG